MIGYENTRLWRMTLGAVTEDPHEEARSRLRVAYLGVRQHAAILAAEIPLDLRMYTVHDASHLDALWETADEIVGPDLQLNAAEGFVLGCAFLLHDLGMGLAAYPRGMEALQEMDVWPGMLAVCVEQVLGRPPEVGDLDDPPDAALGAAKEVALRELHAQQAEALATIHWKSATGATYHLIEDQGLREVFGPLVGRIAHSHWWDVRRLADEFRTIGGAVDLPADWNVDSLLLACILRLADAAHLDARRAPGFLMALRQPTGVSLEHWTFQSYLQRVHRDQDRLRYTSTHRFSTEEASAWWLCLESLRMVDRELRAVDSLLADLGKSRMAVRSVLGVDDPRRLALVIPTDGWIPIDAQVVIGDVSGLVMKLGGAELYGDRPEVAIRELIANGSDAVSLRRSIEGTEDYAGKVTVRLDERSDGFYLEVNDNGVGMSPDVLTQALLDFGRSFWGSALMRKEFPGLVASGYRATGRYGIGFFSVFMLGTRVEVRSRRFDMGASETHVLEFHSGLGNRPLLRRALLSERMSSGGTTVRVKLNNNPTDPYGLLQGTERAASLAELVEFLAPCSPVDLYVASPGAPASERVVQAGDWDELEPGLLYDRIYGNPFVERSLTAPEDRTAFSNTLRDVEEHQKVLGRIARVGALDPPYQGVKHALVTVGGFRAGHVYGLAGVLEGTPDRASRDAAVPLASVSLLGDWATAQLSQVDLASFSDLARLQLAQRMTALGAPLEPSTPVACAYNGVVTAAALESEAAELTQVHLVWMHQVGCYSAREGQLSFLAVEPTGVTVPMRPHEGVYFVDRHVVWLQSAFTTGTVQIWPKLAVDEKELESVPAALRNWWRHLGPTAVGETIRSVARGWHMTLGDALGRATFVDPASVRDTPVGVREDGQEESVIPYVTLRRNGAENH